MSSLAPITLACPLCGSADVFYSCEPKCCFNHVCADCRASFEPVTRFTGAFRHGLQPPDPPPDSSDPTVACAKCESIAVYVDSDQALVCTGCGAVLVLELTEIAAP